MRASLDVAGIEVELRVPAGSLEAVIAKRYAPFLGTVQDPSCTLRLEPWTNHDDPRSGLPAVVERAGATRFDVAHRAFRGALDLAGDGVLCTVANPTAIDEALGILFALMAPAHDGMLMEGAGRIRGGRAGLFLGRPGRSVMSGLVEHHPTLGEGWVLVRRSPGTGWIAAASPFGPNLRHVPPPRMAAIYEVWLCRLPAPGDESSAVQRDKGNEVARSAVVPTADPDIARSVLSLAHQLVLAVPTAELTVDASAAGLPFEMDNVCLLFDRSLPAERPPIQTLEG